MKKALFTLGLLAGMLCGSRAGLVLSDDFSYPDGDITTNSTWYPNSGSTPMLVSNQTLIVTTSRSVDTYHYLTGYPYQTNGPVTALYSSYTLKCTGLPTAAGTYFSHFGGSNVFSTSTSLTGHRARVWASITNNNAGTTDSSGNFYLYIINSVGSTTNGGNQWPDALATNVTYTIVTKYVLATGASTLWVNPATETDPSVSDPNLILSEPGVPPAAPTNGPIPIAAYDFRQATGEGTMLIDNLRVGTHFADVAGTNTAPAISPIADQAILANTATSALAFTVEDRETPATELVVMASSSNPTLVTNTPQALRLSGTGTNRTITVTPTADKQGSAMITVTVSDSVNQSSTAFQVVVGAPSIAPIPGQIAVLNAPVAPVTVTVSDPENDPLTVSVVSSSNPGLLPLGNITLSPSGNTRTLTMNPASGQTGASTVLLSVTDGHNSSSTSFTLTVEPLVGLVFQEDFNYTSFTPGVGNALYGASGGSGGGWQHVSGPTYEIMVTNVTATNGMALLVHTNNEDLGAGFIGSAQYDGNNGYVFYTSFTVNFSFPPSPGGDYFLHLSSSASDTINFRCKVFGASKGAAAGMFRLGIANTANTPVLLPTDLATNTTYTVVTRYNAATGESLLWVNPYSEQSPAAVANDNPGSALIGGVGLRQAGSAIGDLAIGPMLIGTSFSDVATVVPAPAPEPLHASVVGSNLILTWTNPVFTLSSSPTAKGTYTRITGSTSPYTNAISGNAQFFRLVWP